MIKLVFVLLVMMPSVSAMDGYVPQYLEMPAALTVGATIFNGTAFLLLFKAYYLEPDGYHPVEANGDAWVISGGLLSINEWRPMYRMLVFTFDWFVPRFFPLYSVPSLGVWLDEESDHGAQVYRFFVQASLWTASIAIDSASDRFDEVIFCPGVISSPVAESFSSLSTQDALGLIDEAFNSI